MNGPKAGDREATLDCEFVMGSTQCLPSVNMAVSGLDNYALPADISQPALSTCQARIIHHQSAYSAGHAGSMLAIAAQLVLGAAAASSDGVYASVACARVE